MAKVYNKDMESLMRVGKEGKKASNDNIKSLIKIDQEGKKNSGKDMKNLMRVDKEGKKTKTRLSPREKEVYELIVVGKTNKQICKELCICKSTLEKYITKIYQKKGVKNRIELVFRLKDNCNRGQE